MLLISELLPKVQELQNSYKANSVSAVVDFLGSVTLENVLPPKPPLTPRRFLVGSNLMISDYLIIFVKWSDASLVWLSSLIWGEIYVRGMTPLGIWNATNVRLFYVKHTQVQSRQITEAVSNVVGGLLGRTESSQSLRQRN